MERPFESTGETRRQQRRGSQEEVGRQRQETGDRRQVESKSNNKNENDREETQGEQHRERERDSDSNTDRETETDTDTETERESLNTKKKVPPCNIVLSLKVRGIKARRLELCHSELLASRAQSAPVKLSMRSAARSRFARSLQEVGGRVSQSETNRGAQETRRAKTGKTERGKRETETEERGEQRQKQRWTQRQT